MIRPCIPGDFDRIWSIINDGAQAYKDAIRMSSRVSSGAFPRISALGDASNIS